MYSHEYDGKQTETFLDGNLRTNTFDIESVEDNIQVTDEILKDKYLTGAAHPILPMIISVAGRDKKRLEFTMLINPDSLNHGKINVTQAAYTRKGYVTQLWGPNQDILTSTGKTAVFMTGGSGITGFLKTYSYPYRNFLSLVSAYKNNGYTIYDRTKTDDLERAVTRVIDVVNGVELYYDNQTFMGHFNNFTLDDGAEGPFVLNYNFEFVISTPTADYSQVRGHFRPVPQRNQEATRPAKLLNDIKAQNGDTF